MGQASVDFSELCDPALNQTLNDGLYLHINIENVSLNALIDTGSTITIIHTHKFKLLSDEIQNTLQPVKCFLKMADGGPVPCKGVVKIPLNIENQIYQQDVLIANIDAPFVFGL